MNRAVFPVVALLAAWGVAGAQDAARPSSGKLDEYMAAGMEISGVRAPYYDEQGNLQAQLHGGHVRVVEGGRAEVEELRIDAYRDGAVFMTLYAPRCTTEVVEEGGRKVLRVESEGDVLIDLDQMTIAGRGFRFSSAHNRLEILHDSKVLVKASARRLGEVVP